MGLFSRLFGAGKEGKPLANKNDEKPKQNSFLTNSAEFGLGEIDLGISGKVRVDGILAIAALQDLAKKQDKEFQYSVMYTSLLEEGALTVPVVCSIGAEKFSLYFIYQEDDLLKYKDLVKHVSRTAYPNLIYFSSIPIYEGYDPKPIIEPFQLADMRVDKDGKVAGKFAMWWSTEGDPHFHTSGTFEHLSKLNELMKGYETYMAGYVLRQTRIIQEMELKRVQLPENNATYVIDAPEEKKVLLDISQEKGIRFLFPIDKVTKEYRERFLKGIMVDFAASIIPLRQHGAPVDEDTDPNSYDWFNFMAKVVKEHEDSGEYKDHQIGIIEYNTQMN